MKNTEIPIFKAFLNDENEGLDFISVVDRPAIQSQFLKFSEMNELKLCLKDNDRMILTGAVLIPDFLVTRFSEDNKPFYITFDKQTIFKLAQKEAQNGTFVKANLNHTEVIPEGCFFFESFIVDNSRGIKAPEGLSHLKDGSWIRSLQCSKEFWEKEVLTGNVTGFSIEGKLSMEAMQGDDFVQSQLIDFMRLNS